MNRGASCGVLCAALLANAPQLPRFRAVVKEVRVDVLVTKNGEPVTGLTQADFDVRDNGAVQRINALTSEDLPVNVVLALDASESVKGERLHHLQQAGHHLLSGLRPNDRAGLVRFADTVVIESGLTSDAAAVDAALMSSSQGRNTPLVDAAACALLLAGTSPGSRALVLVFSDGVEVSSYMSRASVLDTAKRSEAVVYGVTLNKSPEPFLDDIADATGGEVMRLDKVNDLDNAFSRVLERFRHRYVLSFTPSQDDTGAWHRLDVQVRRRGVTVQSRRGYFGS